MSHSVSMKKVPLQVHVRAHSILGCDGTQERLDGLFCRVCVYRRTEVKGVELIKEHFPGQRFIIDRKPFLRMMPSVDVAAIRSARSKYVVRVMVY